MDVNTALYSNVKGTELLREQNQNKLLLVGSESKYFTTTIKEFIITKKFFQLF